MELYIILILIIIILFIIIAKIISSYNNMKSMLNTLEAEYNSWNEEFLFTKRELIRLKDQIKIYEEQVNNTQEIIINNKKIKKNPIYKGKKVLVGDYVDISAENTMKMLQSFGITVDIVKSGEDIVDRIKNNYKYDIIFTNNIFKKGFGGKETLDKLREIKGFKTPVVIHTVSFNERHKFINIYGFDEYIEKPLDQEKLKPILEKFLEEKRKNGRKKYKQKNDANK